MNWYSQIRIKRKDKKNTIKQPQKDQMASNVSKNGGNCVNQT